ncbi:hypothetical protein [Halogeometricum sp. CBA1124]|nr:hypothetical protein [Halogeometricum sp. CBA1124]
MEETLRRLIGGPDPDEVSGILSDETADSIEAQLEKKRERAVEEKNDLAERFE